MRRILQIALLLLAAALLAACAGQAATPLPTPAPLSTLTPLPTATVLLPTQTPSATPPPTPTQPSLFAPVSEADWQVGPSNAAVTIIEYSDFQCSFCARVSPVLKQLRQDFPEDLRLVYRHFPLPQHNKAQAAAVAAEAAGAQGKFWEMHDLLFAEYENWYHLPPSEFRDVLATYARRLELDEARFRSDLVNPELMERVDAAYAAAINIPLPGTPFLLFNGQPIQDQGMFNYWALATLIRLEMIKARQFAVPPPEIIDPFRRYTATVATEHGNIVIELFAEKAPLTVNNFVFLAQAGWFDGVTFHRVIPGFAAQAGDPSGTGYGGPGYYIPDEIVPELRYDAAGVVGMANAGPNTNGSQFFISLAPLPDLDGRYTIFGRVIEGLEVLGRLTPRDPNAQLDAPPGDVIHTITIEEQ